MNFRHPQAVDDRSNLALTAAAALASAVIDEMERQESARAEIAALSAELAPIRAELAQGLATAAKAA